MPKRFDGGPLQPLDATAVGARLKLARQALGLKPSEIADSLEIERTYWSRFENGKRLPTLEFSVLMCCRYPLTLDFIYRGQTGALPEDFAKKLRAVKISEGA